MADASPCCPTSRPGVTCDYTPRGEIVSLAADLPAYYASFGTPVRGVVLIMDIFGLSPQLKLVADRLAEAGSAVVAPDFFNGAPWPLDDMPPSDRAAFGAFLAKYPPASTLPQFERGVAHLRARGVTGPIAAVGFCWGARLAFVAAAQADGAQPSHIAAVAAVHPSFLTAELAQAVLCPTLVLPSKDDPVMEDVQAALNAHAWGARNVWQRFDTMHHGWCCARGDWKVPEQADAASEAIGMMAAFFERNAS